MKNKTSSDGNQKTLDWDSCRHGCKWGKQRKAVRDIDTFTLPKDY